MRPTSLLSAIAIGTALMGSTAIAATIGSLDSTRNYLSYQLDGSNYDDIRNAILADGHSVTAGTGTVTAGYLSGLDVFFTGMLDTAAALAEIAALQAFVSAGGTLVIGADNTFVSSAANYNSWFNPFGLAVTGNTASGGTWANLADPLLANGVAGTALGFSGGTDFAAGSYTTLATDSQGDAAVVSLSYGSGWVIGLGDGNFFDDPASAQSEQFFQNIMNRTPTPVPLPAAGLLLLGALGAVGALRRRKNV